MHDVSSMYQHWNNTCLCLSSSFSTTKPQNSIWSHQHCKWQHGKFPPSSETYIPFSTNDSQRQRRKPKGISTIYVLELHAGQMDGTGQQRLTQNLPTSMAMQKLLKFCQTTAKFTKFNQKVKRQTCLFPTPPGGPESRGRFLLFP